LAQFTDFDSLLYEGRSEPVQVASKKQYPASGEELPKNYG